MLRIRTLIHNDVQSVVEATMEAIAAAMEQKDAVMSVGFGTFATGKRKAVTVNHTRTGKPIRVQAKTLPVFRTGSALRKRVAAKRPRGRLKKEVGFG